MKISLLHYSSYFGVSHDEFVRLGVYDGFVNEDSILHINPLLLKKCNAPEFEGADDKRIDKVIELRQKMIEEIGNAPEVIVVDATEKPSASKL